MNQNQPRQSLFTAFSSFADFATEQAQLNEFTESVSLVASSIFGLFSNRSVSETAVQLARVNTSSDFSKNVLFSLHKRLNCDEFLAYLENSDSAIFSGISPDFFNSITKHFGRSQSIENYSRLLFNLCRIYGAELIFFRNFFGIVRDCDETKLLVKYTSQWDYSSLNVSREWVVSRIFLSSFERMTASSNLDETLAILPLCTGALQAERIEEFVGVFNRLLYNFIMAVISKKNTQRLEGVLSVLLDTKIEMSLITLNKIMDALNKNCPSSKYSDMIFSAIETHGLTPNIITLNCYLESYATLGKLDKVYEIFDKIKASGAQPDSYTFSILIKGCKNFPSEELFKVHEFIFNTYKTSTCRDHIIINCLLDECVMREDDKLTTEIFADLESKTFGFEPDNISMNIMFKYAIKNRNLELAKRLTKEVMSKNFTPNLSTFNSLLNLSLKMNRVGDAMQLYENLKLTPSRPDSFTFSIMLNGAKNCHFELSMVNALLDDIKSALTKEEKKLDEVVFNSILEILFTYDLLEQFDYFHAEMKRQNIPESSFTFSVILKKLSKMEDFEKINSVFDEILEKKICISDFNYGFLLDYFAKMRRMDWASAIYNKLRTAGVELSSIIFTTMIKGFILTEEYDSAIKVFNDIRHLTDQPGMIITYNCALDVYVHQDKIEEAIELFEEIDKIFKADLISYSTIVKGLCKLNDRTRALNMIKRMIESEIEYDISILNLFLENCAASDNQKTGITSFEYFIKKKVHINEITLGIMVKIYGAQFKLKNAFDLVNMFAQFNTKPSLIFFTNLIHVSFYNRKPNKAELVHTLMRKEGIKGDKLMYSKMIEGLLRFKQTKNIMDYVQAAIDDQCTLKPDLINQLFEIFEDEPASCQLLEKVKSCGRTQNIGEEGKNRLKNNYHQTNTQSFKNQIWQRNRERQETEKRAVQEKNCRNAENPERKVFGGDNKNEKQAERGFFRNNNQKSSGFSGSKQPMVLHNFRANKKVE